MLKSKFMGLHYKKIWYHTSWLKSSCHCKRITKVIRNLFMVPNWPLLTCWVPNSTVSPSPPARPIRAKSLYVSYTNAGKWRKRKTICATFFLNQSTLFSTLNQKALYYSWDISSYFSRVRGLITFSIGNSRENFPLCLDNFQSCIVTECLFVLKSR